MSGWIKLHRKLIETCFYGNSHCVHLAVHCLLKANHSDKKTLFNGKALVVKRGSFITGLNSLKKQTRISTQTLRTCLKSLSATDFLTVQPTNRFSIISICKYDEFQGEEFDTNKQTNKQLTNNQQTTNKQLTTNKNDKNIKNDKKETIQAPPVLQAHVHPNGKEPKKETDVQRVVNGWKYITGIPMNDKNWDKVFYPRFSRSAKELINLFGSPNDALDCMEYVYDWLKSKKLDCTIETIVKHSDKYREIQEAKR